MASWIGRNILNMLNVTRLAPITLHRNGISFQAKKPSKDDTVGRIDNEVNAGDDKKSDSGENTPLGDIYIRIKVGVCEKDKVIPEDKNGKKTDNN